MEDHSFGTRDLHWHDILPSCWIGHPPLQRCNIELFWRVYYLTFWLFGWGWKVRKSELSRYKENPRLFMVCRQLLESKKGKNEMYVADFACGSMLFVSCVIFILVWNSRREIGWCLRVKKFGSCRSLVIKEVYYSFVLKYRTFSFGW